MTTNEEKWTPAVRQGEKLEDVPLSQWIGEALGAASMCWNPRPTGEFDSVEAKRISDALQLRVEAALEETANRVRRDMMTDGYMKDDDREVGWAPRKIRRLESQLGGVVQRVALLEPNVFTDTGFCRVTELAKRVSAETDRLNALRDQISTVGRDLADVQENYVTEAGFEDLIGRVRRLEGQTEFDTSEDDAHIRTLASRVESLEDRVSAMTPYVELESRVRELEKAQGTIAFRDWKKMTTRLLQLEEAMNSLNGRTSQTESRLNAYGVPEVRGEYRDRRSEAEDEFSAPVGQDPENARNLTAERERVVAATAAMRGNYDRGMHAGVKAVLDNGEQRIRNYMRGSFSSGTVEGVVRALRGIVNAADET